MIFSDEQVAERLSSPDNIINLVLNNQEDNKQDNNNGGLEIRQKEDNRGQRGPQIPDVIRKLIANTAILSDEPLSQVGTVFGVCAPTVSNYSRGLVHTRLDDELREIADKSTQEKTNKAHDLALDSLVGSLGLVKEKLDTVTTAREASTIAVRLSRVVKDLRPEDNESKTKTLVVVTMPAQKKEAHFDFIDV